MRNYWKNTYGVSLTIIHSPGWGMAIFPFVLSYYWRYMMTNHFTCFILKGENCANPGNILVYYFDSPLHRCMKNRFMWNHIDRLWYKILCFPHIDINTLCFHIQWYSRNWLDIFLLMSQYWTSYGYDSLISNWVHTFLE